jgi:biotin operon repressor
LLAHVTAEDPDGNGKYRGIVEHGNPVPTKRIAADLGRSRDATLTNLETLEAGNYIERSAAVGHPYEYKEQLLQE